MVVHLAAMADVGACERNPEQATAVNARATASIAQLCGVHGARLIFVSTEYVFDGERGYYREDEPPNPITHYGRTKQQAEESVAGLASRWSVVRTSIVYGWRSDGGRNFAPGLIDHLASGQTYEASTGVMRTPVYVEHLVDGIGALTETDRTGIYHIAGSDWVSMYDFAMTVARAFSLDDGAGDPARLHTWICAERRTTSHQTGWGWTARGRSGIWVCLSRVFPKASRRCELHKWATDVDLELRRSMIPGAPAQWRGFHTSTGGSAHPYRGLPHAAGLALSRGAVRSWFESARTTNGLPGCPSFQR